MNEYKINDLFEVKQGKLMLNKVEKGSKSSTNADISNLNTIKVLTMNAVNFDMNLIDADFFSEYVSTNPNDLTNKLKADNYIINRVGKIKGMSLINVDMNFAENIIASHHFIVLKPRKIVEYNLPLFHTLVDVALKNLMDKKTIIRNDDTQKKLNDEKTKSKVQYITVKEIQDIKISIPPEGFDELTRMFMEIYEPYKESLKSFISNNKKLEVFKNNFNKKQ